MKKQKENSGKWFDEGRPILESNGEILPGDRKFKINVDLHITPGALMTPGQLDHIANYCWAIANSYKASKKYINAPDGLETEAQKVKRTGRY